MCHKALTVCAVLFAMSMSLVAHAEDWSEPPKKAILIDLDTGDWAYQFRRIAGKPRGSHMWFGWVVTHADDDEGTVAISIYDPVVQDEFVDITEAKYYKSASIRAKGWANEYKGWIYSLPKGHKYQHIFVSNQPTREIPNHYPVAGYIEAQSAWVPIAFAERAPLKE